MKKQLLWFALLMALLASCKLFDKIYSCPENCVTIRGRVVTGDGTEPFLHGKAKLYMNIHTEKASAEIGQDGSYEITFPFSDAEQNSKQNRYVDLSIELDNNFAGLYFVKTGGYSSSMSYEYDLEYLKKGTAYNLPDCYIQRKARMDFIMPANTVFNDKDYLKVTCYGDYGFSKKRIIRYFHWGNGGYDAINGLPISIAVPSKSKIFIRREFFINNIKTTKLDSLVLNTGGMSIFNMMTD
jgi:hypothetical protein